MKSLLQQAVASLSEIRDAHTALLGLIALEHTGGLRDDNVHVQTGLTALAGRDPDQLNRALEDLGFDTLKPAAFANAMQLVRRVAASTHPHLAVALRDICEELAPITAEHARLPTRPDRHEQLRPGDWILDVSCGTGVGVLQVLHAARCAWGSEGARSLTFVAVTASPLRALATRLTLAAAGCSEQAVVFCGQVLVQPVLAWNNDQLQPAEFRRCIGTPPDHQSVPVRELLAADYAGPLVVPARLLARRARLRPASATS